MTELEEMKKQMALMQAHIEKLESKAKMADIEFDYAQYRVVKAERMSEIQKFHRTLAKQKILGVDKTKRIGWKEDTRGGGS